MDIRLIQVDGNNRINFKMSSKTISGVEELVQKVVLTLLDEPGRSVLFPESGGAISSLVGQNIDVTDNNDVFSDITTRVKATEKEIIQNQIGLNAQPSEKLREIHIVSIERDTNSVDTILVTLRIVNEAGRQVDVIV